MEELARVDKDREGDSPLDVGSHLCASEATNELTHRHRRSQGRSLHVADEDRGWGSQPDQGLGLHQHSLEAGKDLTRPVRSGGALLATCKPRDLCFLRDR